MSGHVMKDGGNNIGGYSKCFLLPRVCGYGIFDQDTSLCMTPQSHAQ